MEPLIKPLATIGYETDTLDGLIGRLKAAGVETVVDVRAVASSRRPGFSKTLLGNSLRAEGVDYVHLRPLGAPKAGREAASGSPCYATSTTRRAATGPSWRARSGHGCGARWWICEANTCPHLAA